jgi:SEC-C motif
MSSQGVSRNGSCPCGSGKKYKKCCLARRNQVALYDPPDEHSSDNDLTSGVPPRSSPVAWKGPAPDWSPPGTALLPWKQFVHMTDLQLAGYDVALVNLACALDLPGAGNTDVEACRNKLLNWTERVRDFTEGSLPQYRGNPAACLNSEAYFRCLAMVTHLERDLALRYNPAKRDDRVPLDPPDTFVHGALVGEGGCCASLPVVFASVARRLGYPLKLANTRGKVWGHLFNRWDEPGGERFNMDSSGHGLASLSDEYYRSGRYELTDEHISKACWLASMTPRQELACFVSERSQFLLRTGQPLKACESLLWACALWPENRGHYNVLAKTLESLHASLEARKPPGFPVLRPILPPRQFPESLPYFAETNYLIVRAEDALLRDAEFEARWWGPLRAGRVIGSRPSTAIITYPGDGMEISFEFYHTGYNASPY